MLIKNVPFDLTRWIKKEYNDPPVIITENGWSEDAALEDDDRIEFLHDHLQEIQNVILNNECNLKGYTGIMIMKTALSYSSYIIFFFSLVNH